MSGPKTPAESLDASKFRFVIVASRFNEEITDRLVEGARACFDKHGAPDVPVVWVPGAFELPLATRALASAPGEVSGLGARIERGRGGVPSRIDAIVALGCVVRGETAHFDFVAGEAARGLMDVMLQTGTPVAFGIVTTENMEQARARAGGDHGNKGWDAAETAIEMAALLATAD